MHVRLNSNVSDFLKKHLKTGAIPSVKALEIETDSRKNFLEKLFICFKGPNFDGHEFAQTVLDKGATGIVVERSFDKHLKLGPSQFLCVVDDTLAFFSDLAHLKRKGLTAKVIAMTGSVGKTSVRSILECCLQTYGKVYATKGNDNNEIGVPKTILDCEEDVDYLILEHGARKLHDIAKLVEVSHPDVAMLLNAKESHLGPFGNFENLVTTKKQILNYPASQKIVFADQPEFSDVHLGAITFGSSLDSSIKMTETQANSPGLRRFEFYVKEDPTKSVEVEHSFPHAPFGYNLAACLATALALNLDTKIYFQKLAEWKSVPGRFHIERRGKNIVIDDTYNASPSSVMAGPETLKTA